MDTDGLFILVFPMFPFPLLGFGFSLSFPSIYLYLLPSCSLRFLSLSKPPKKQNTAMEKVLTVLAKFNSTPPSLSHICNIIGRASPLPQLLSNTNNNNNNIFYGIVWDSIGINICFWWVTGKWRLFNPSTVTSQRGPPYLELGYHCPNSTL